MKEVKELGRMPNRFKTPKNSEERAENQLAKRIAQHKNEFPKDVWEDICQSKKASQAELQRKKATELLNEVRTLGRYPVEHQASEDPDKEKERILAHNLRKARAAALFQPAEEAELAELQWMVTREKEAATGEAKEERCRQKALDVMEAVRAFGKMPRFQMRPQTKEAKQENQLRRQLDTVLKQKRLNANELAELDEFKWMRRREGEWSAIARAQPMEETKKDKILDQ